MSTPTDADALIQKYASVIRLTLVPRRLSYTLGKIPSLSRRLLALKRYLFQIKKDGWAAVEQRWAWTDEQFEAWRGSPADRTLTAEWHAIRRRFERDNPGFRLRRGGRHRSLQEQIDSWNGNTSVGTNAEAYLRRTRKEILRTKPEGQDGTSVEVPVYPDLGPYLDQDQRLLSFTVMPKAALPGQPPLDPKWLAVLAFRDFLSERFHHVTPLMVATPGMSPHGQARAIDFRILDGSTGRKVVGATDSAAWDRDGWTERLRDAVSPSRHFTGPLLVPYEPWHYTYIH